VLAAGTPPALALWYRSSPRQLAPLRHGAIEVTPTDPPSNDTGMRTAIIDTRGRLLEFHAVPPQFDAAQTPAEAPRWSDLFDAAGLSMAAFRPAAPQWTPRDFADTRAAWEGPLPDRPDLRVRVEAAAYQGRAVSFYLIGPWSRPTRMQPAQHSTLEAVVNGFVLAALLVLFGGAALLARDNLRVGRGDRRAATRIALFVMAFAFMEWAAVAHHSADINLEFRLFVKVFQVGAGAGLIMWVLYVAIEPFARRFWPDSLLGWTRLVSGYIRDPRVGRDLLIGCLFGVAILLAHLARLLLPGALGYAAVMPLSGREVSVLTRATAVIGVWDDAVLNSPAAAFFAVMVFVVLRLLLKRRWLAIVLGTAIVAVVGINSAATMPWIDVPLQLATAALVTMVIVRFGLLAASVAFVVWAVGLDVPFTTNVSHWSAAGSNLTIAAFTGLVVFGFVASRAGQPLLGKLEV
jgi:hypothetical protein